MYLKITSKQNTVSFRNLEKQEGVIMKENFVELTKRESITINGGMIGTFQIPTLSEWLPHVGGLASGFGTGYLLSKTFA